MSTPEEFLQDLARQAERYRAMTALGEEMVALLLGDRLNDLPPVMERKSVIMREIQEIEARVAPMRRGWAEIRSTLSPEVDRRASQVLLEARAALEALVAVENRAAALLERTRSAASSDLDSLLKRRRLNDAYGDKPKP
ncbi:MAG TPA: hypothetical protein VGK61_01115 [Planctomycetota bacterium]